MAITVLKFALYSTSLFASFQFCLQLSIALCTKTKHQLLRMNQLIYLHAQADHCANVTWWR